MEINRGNACDLRLDSLGREGYDFICQDRRFYQLKGALERYAECKAAEANT